MTHRILTTSFPYDGIDPTTNNSIKCVHGTFVTASDRCICDTGYTSSGTVNIKLFSLLKCNDSLIFW